MKKFFVVACITVFISAFTMCNKADRFPDNGYDERLSGGAATVFDVSSKAFTHMVDGLDTRGEQVHGFGDGAFEQVFVAPPAPVFAGLGPIYNNLSCISCHRNDGQGIPTAGFSNSGLLMRISIPGKDAFGGPLSIDGFGTQIQDQAVLGIQPEANVQITYNALPVSYPDGKTVLLQKPEYALTNPYRPLPAGYMLSPRLAPPVIGMGLLELVPESTVLSFADENDMDGDGISGKPNYVYDPYLKKTMLGRFGLKANTPELLVQVANAYQQDMGVTSFVQPDESSIGQSQNGSSGDAHLAELPDSLLRHVTFYIKTLAVPARRNVNDANVKAGAMIFAQINCSGCHKPTMQTGVDVTLPVLSNQRIHPYTDLLLHDMGEELADNRPDFLATGTEWRTQPLWGIGLLQKTTGTAYYLHDGRARTLEEAILWHGGEAEKSKQQFMNLNEQERNQLIQFLQSL